MKQQKEETVKESKRDIREQVTSYQAAAVICNLTDKEIASDAAFVKLCRIAKALNEGWVPDWNDWSKRKYWIYSNYIYSVFFGGYADSGSTAGFGCSTTGNAPSNLYAYIGSRLCFKSADLANHVISTFPELLKDLFMIEQ